MTLFAFPSCSDLNLLSYLTPCTDYNDYLYNICVIFEWDRGKSAANREKHGIDFETAKGLWLDEDRIEVEAPYPVEERTILIARLHGRVWAAVYTMRGAAIRLISVRHARKKEVELYEKAKAG